MWSYLVLISGGFFYSVAAIQNTKATVNATTTIYQASGDSIFLLHQLAKKQRNTGDWPVETVPMDFTQLQNKTNYIDTIWQARLVTAPAPATDYGQCLLTYKRATIALGDPRALVSSLTQFSNSRRKVGFINASGAEIAYSSTIPPLPNPLPADVRNTPFIYECNI